MENQHKDMIGLQPTEPDLLYQKPTNYARRKPMEQTKQEQFIIRRRTRVVGAFPDGNSALMLVCARLRHVVGTQWGSKKYMNMKHLEAMETETTAV